MDALVQDVKAAARSLRARKAFVALAVGTLALALGANTSVFGVIHAVLLEQLPYRDPERLAILWNVKHFIVISSMKYPLLRHRLKLSI